MVLLGASARDALVLVDNLRKRVSDLGFHFDRKRVAVTMSCGVAAVEPDDTSDMVMERADKALYQAKQLGRNRAVLA